MLIDVTQRHRSQLVLESLYEHLNAQVRAHKREIEERSAFVRLLAHDVRGPLTVIKGALRTVADHADELDAERVEDLHTRAAVAADQALRMVAELLETERWSEGSPLAPQAVSARELAEQIVEEADLGERHVGLDLDDGEVVVDPVVVSRAVTNLLLNAARHSPDGATIWLRTRVLEDGGRLQFSVEDEGPGIPEELRERIFEPFISVSDKRPDETVGLGLALVRALARMHGGEVWVEDLPVIGSAFHLTVRSV